MFQAFVNLLQTILLFAIRILIPFAIACALYGIYIMIWYKIIKKREKIKTDFPIRYSSKKRGWLKTIFLDIPKQYATDLAHKDPNAFTHKGIHMFCGEQGSGKTIACAKMIMDMQREFPQAKTITNFEYTLQNKSLKHWTQLINYTNGEKGVIVGIDEIQNWFQSGNNQLPEEMLEIVTQNRKNRRIICCTAQVFTRVSKAIREQVTLVYNPHTFLGCFTIVIKRKPIFDSEGNVKEMKYRGMYYFTHSKEVRECYDTYKVIHTLAQTGVKPKQKDPEIHIHTA